MKLIDEKIKALGLTKGQYCEKYGFKFKDFAAKVHTLEAKIEWANTFLKPLGLSAQILPKDSAEAVRFFLTEQISEQMDDAEVRFLGGETPPEVKDRIFYDEIEKTVSMYNSIEGVSVKVKREGTVGEYLDKGLGKGPAAHAAQIPARRYECVKCGTEASAVGMPPLVCTAPNAERTSGICGGEFRPKIEDDADDLL